MFADDDASPLFRLKEGCHALFRPGSTTGELTRPREVLFDLAVGSLFHEAMKFRESFYQREVYGPRVRALREEAGEEAATLFREFEKILATVSERLEEGLAETEVLLAGTAEQLLVLIGQHRDDGHLARFLIERSEEAGAVFGRNLDALLTTVYGGPAAGHALAGRSYLQSGYFPEAERSLSRAIAAGGERELLEPTTAYARGMAAYLRGDYGTSVEQISDWADAAPELEAGMAEVAAGALAKLDKLAEGKDRDRLVKAANTLVARLSDRGGKAATAPQPPRAAS